MLDDFLGPRGIESGAVVVCADDSLSYNIVDIVVLAPGLFLRFNFRSATRWYIQETRETEL